METGVVAPDGGMRIDGENGRDDLGGEEEENGNIKRSTDESELFFFGGFEKPDGGDKDGGEIDKKHLIKLKNFRGFGPEDEGGEEKEGIKSVMDDFGVYRFGDMRLMRHGD